MDFDFEHNEFRILFQNQFCSPGIFRHRLAHSNIDVSYLRRADRSSSAIRNLKTRLNSSCGLLECRLFNFFPINPSKSRSQVKNSRRIQICFRNRYRIVGRTKRPFYYVSRVQETRTELPAASRLRHKNRSKPVHTVSYLFIIRTYLRRTIYIYM